MKKRPLPDRFWEKVAVGDEGSCWHWTAFINPKGYGMAHVAVGQPMWHAHRVAWMLTHGPVAEGHVICHACDTRSCCNPNHLFMGLQQDNIQDMVQKGRHRTGSKPGRQTKSSKLTPGEVEEIRRLLQLGEPQQAIGALFGVSQTTVSEIKRRRTWDT